MSGDFDPTGLFIGLIVWGLMAWVGLDIVNGQGAVMGLLTWAAPKVLQVVVAVFGGTIVKKLARTAIKHKFGLEVPV